MAEGVEGEDDCRDTLWTVQSGAQVFGQTFVGQSAQPLEQVPVALKVGPEHPGIAKT
ncbi:MAG TPA: hypothetical protein VFE51_04605 [Verrucomicrobiae bacterium]|nr:hypothetical protein [Verrucomicrobiae bacterium]